MSGVKDNKGEIKINPGTDPFQNYYGKPMVSGAGPQSRYIGRVVIELWEEKTPTSTDTDQFGLLIDPANGINGNELLLRVTNALPLHQRKLHNA